LLNLLRRGGEIVNPEPHPGAAPDPHDDKFIACAVSGRANFLVTGNKRHFPQTRYASAKVVNAVELLEFITLELGT
jgi:predicted nucleic acid-binding protein